MKTYTGFIIPNREFPNNVVVKRLREKTDEKLKARNYQFLGHVEMKTKRTARRFFERKAMIERPK